VKEEYEYKDLSYGFYDTSHMTYNHLWDTEPGTLVRIDEGGYSTVAWLIGENDSFKKTGCYDVVEPDQGMRTVHWDHLRLVVEDK
jgi:hypothetical protein